MKLQQQDPSWVPVFDNLREAIISHRLLPGTRLAEDELCNIYGLGRTVIRAALSALTHEGLLTHIPIVVSMSPSQQRLKLVMCLKHDRWLSLIS